MRSSLLKLVFACGLVAIPASAQFTLNTPFTGNTYWTLGGGNMFDITATNPVVIDSFDAHLIGGYTYTIQVFTVTAGTSYVPVTTTPAAWTMIGSATVLAVNTNVPTPVPLNINQFMPSGQTRGFYVTTTPVPTGTAAGMLFTAGVVAGGPWANDANIQVFEGSAVSYQFATVLFYDWNGAIHYHLAANLLLATTSGGGVGDLLLGLTMISAGANEGYLLVSGTATGPVGAGPFFGIYVDGVTFALAQEPLGVGDPLHFVVGPIGVFPDQQFILPPGTLLLGGQVWDAVAVVFGPGFSYLGFSNTQRLVW